MTRPTCCSIGLALSVLAATACTDAGPASAGDDLDDPQLPARGVDDVQTWLAAGAYRAWHCEPEPHAGRSPSPHGRNRVCNNDALYAAAGTGAYPAGAAAVKEIFDGATIVTFAVSRKLDDGPGGDTWYWYEGNADKTFANGVGASNCTGCHAGAPRDYVFTVAR